MGREVQDSHATAHERNCVRLALAIMYQKVKDHVR